MTQSIRLSKLLFCLLCLLTLAAHAGGPRGSYAFREYGPDQGLRNLAVTTLAQDHAGFIYVGTEDGLYRYDGDHFARLGTADGLPSDGITTLHVASDGRLWVATLKGLVAWDGARVDPSTLSSLPVGAEVLGITSSDSGRMIVSTTSGFFERAAGRFSLIPGLAQSAGAAWMSHDGATTLIAINGQLYLRDAHARWVSRKLPQATTTEAVQAIVQDPAGRIWLRGRQMLIRLNRFDASPEDLHTRLPGEAVQKGELYLDATGKVWAPTNNGIVGFNGDRQVLIDAAHGLPTAWATTLLIDREGSMWVGSEGVQQVLGRLAWTSFTQRNGLPSDTVWAVFRDRAGTLWVGTNRGVARATESGWSTLPMTRERSFYTFAESATGDLWIGGNSGHTGVNTLLLRPAGATEFQPVALDSTKGPSTVNSIAFGPDGALYVATLAHGLHRVTRVGTGFRAAQVVLPGGMPTEQINQLATAPGGRLWVSGNQGLALFDGRGWRRLGVADGLLEKEIETITPIDADNLWVSYWNVTGLSHLRITGNTVKAVAQFKGPKALVGDTIYSMGLDRSGIAWLGTALEIKRWRSNHVERFGRADGLPGNDAAANGFWADADGDVWFGLSNGLAHFHARFDVQPPGPPAVVVTSLQDARGHVLKAAKPRVAWSDRVLTFRFSALSFVAPGRLDRQVRLIGFENGWHDTDFGEARYTGLLPGTYRFEARARYGAGPYGAPAWRNVVVLPPWWLTWWFLTLVAFGLLALLVLAYRIRVGSLRRRTSLLEALVTERTRDLKVAMAALEESSMIDPLTGLKNRRFLETMIPAEIARCVRERRANLDLPPAARTRNVDLCVLMVDLDYFKSVNDEHGHAAGDAVLHQIGLVLRASCRESDVVVRWGGEEFMILARNANRAQVQALADQVCRSVRAHPFDIGNGVVLRKTCSVGFTAFPLQANLQDTNGWEQAVDLADQCMYVAKLNGRDAWVGCLPVGQEPVEHPLEDQTVERELREIAGCGLCAVVTSFPNAGVLRWKDSAGG